MEEPILYKLEIVIYGLTDDALDNIPSCYLNTNESGLKGDITLSIDKPDKLELKEKIMNIKKYYKVKHNYDFHTFFYFFLSNFRILLYISLLHPMVNDCPGDCTACF